jgi:hypothetical protein
MTGKQLMMKEILSNYAYEMKDKKHFISQSEYIILSANNNSNRMFHNVACFY